VNEGDGTTSLERLGETIDRVRSRLNETVLGQDAAVEALLAAYLASGHALQGAPATATLRVWQVAGSHRLVVLLVQFTPT
jgi:MoxR-like ATPase